MHHASMKSKVDFAVISSADVMPFVLLYFIRAQANSKIGSL